MFYSILIKFLTDLIEGFTVEFIGPESCRGIKWAKVWITVTPVTAVRHNQISWAVFQTTLLTAASIDCNLPNTT